MIHILKVRKDTCHLFSQKIQNKLSEHSCEELLLLQKNANISNIDNCCEYLLRRHFILQDIVVYIHRILRIGFEFRGFLWKQFQKPIIGLDAQFSASEMRNNRYFKKHHKSVKLS